MIDPQLAADIASRYGAVVPENIDVKVIPRGQTATYIPYVWDGRDLVAVDPEQARDLWKRAAASSARRQIAARQRKKSSQINPKPDRVKPTDPRIVAAKERVQKAKEYAADGRTIDEMASFLGLDRKYCFRYCAKNGISFIPTPRKTTGGYKTSENSARGQMIKRRIEDWTRRIANGETAQDIADASGMRLKTVRDFLTRNGIEFPRFKQGMTARKVAEREGRKQRMAKMWEGGATIYRIRKDMGISSATVREYAQELGITLTYKCVVQEAKVAERRAMVRKLDAQGIKSTEIAAQVGAPLRVVQRDIVFVRASACNEVAA